VENPPENRSNREEYTEQYINQTRSFLFCSVSVHLTGSLRSAGLFMAIFAVVHLPSTLLIWCDRIPILHNVPPTPSRADRSPG
jgi:hypothetical protein